jgi:hypothetical protein
MPNHEKGTSTACMHSDVARSEQRVQESMLNFCSGVQQDDCLLSPKCRGEHALPQGFPLYYAATFDISAAEGQHHQRSCALQHWCWPAKVPNTDSVECAKWQHVNRSEVVCCFVCRITIWVGVVLGAVGYGEASANRVGLPLCFMLFQLLEVDQSLC